jgi:uncharacterized protein YnzC (UPF0291/DUF896 family)
MQAKDIKCSQDKINNLDQVRKSLDKTVNMLLEQQDLRKKYLKRYYYTWPTKQKFINLMAESSLTVINGFCKFIYNL